MRDDDGRPDGLDRRRRVRKVRAVCAALAALVGTATASAQELERFTADSVIAVDVFRGENVSDRPQIVIDASAGMRVGDHWQLFIRPWLRKARPTTPTGVAPAWDAQLYQAGARYERPGPIATRFEIGQLVAPIGLGMLDWRPNLNPTIVPHLSYVVSMPAFDTTIPRQTPIAQNYPLGAQVTVSTLRWDTRVAVINAAPTHGWSIGADNNPRQAPILAGGAGITPVVGLRLGVSLAHGQYVAREETRTRTDGRTMTLVGGEGEYAFRYTKLAGEMIRTSFETTAGSAEAYQYFIQGVQTLTPRLFAAARHEGTSAPPLVNGVVPGRRTHMKMIEATAGIRVTPDVTLRTSYYARQPYNATLWDNQVGLSLVWTRRWW
jgi:hypothetical protein